MTGKDLALLLLSFALGSVPFAYLLTRWNLGGDIRQMGSGNVGATNVLRTQGKLLGALTLVLDFAKAAAAVWACRRWGDAPWLDTAGGAAAVLGHCYPPVLGFRGGKGIASGLGAFLFIAPLPTLIALGAFVLEVLTLRFVSLGSIVGSLTFGASMLALHAVKGWYSAAQVAVACGLCLLLVQRHHKNIARLLRGEEPRIWGKKKASPEGKEPA